LVSLNLPPDQMLGPLFFLHPDTPGEPGIYGQPQPAGPHRGTSGNLLKIGFHGGTPVERPDSVTSAGPDTIRGILDRASRFLPAVGTGTVIERERCWYSMTPDEGFLLDWLDDEHTVFVAGGFSGHGFKFAPVIGRSVAELILEGSTEYEIHGMGLSRWDLRPK
ncbi:MAG: FAD-dependent oxidoreductase, partial [Spirochaetales bacterium]